MWHHGWMWGRGKGRERTKTGLFRIDRWLHLGVGPDLRRKRQWRWRHVCRIASSCSSSSSRRLLKVLLRRELWNWVLGKLASMSLRLTRTWDFVTKIGVYHLEEEEEEEKWPYVVEWEEEEE